MDPALIALTAILAFGGGYLGAYVREKGRNLATREDLEPIVRGQETIKQQLAHSTFVEGRRWDLTRRLIWDLQKQLATMMQAAIDLNALSRANINPERRQEQLHRLLQAALQTSTLRALAASLIPDPQGEYLDAAVRNACQGLPRDNWMEHDEFEAFAARLHAAILRVQVAARSILFGEPLPPSTPHPPAPLKGG
jgi:hypothetical protein